MLFTIGVTAVVTFILSFIGMSSFLAILRSIGVYTIVGECRAQVFVLFGKVELVIDEPGLHFLYDKLGWKALVVNFLGSVWEVDLRLDQEYLRSQPVNSEEGAPMGIGIWYEMWIEDPVSYLFKNSDPRGSLRANVGNATVRNLSNMRLSNMLGERHEMSRQVRDDVSLKSRDWGFSLGSVYVRKVHFRDAKMISQIEAKVVNRLRQVTSAIKQDGTNQVNIISSAAERQAAVEFAKSAAKRPEIVGDALAEIAQYPEIAEALFAVLENQKILEGKSQITLLPEGVRNDLMTQLYATKSSGTMPSNLPPTPSVSTSPPASNTGGIPLK